MDTRFQNKYTQTHSIIKEFFRFTFFQTKAMLICDILMSVCAIVLIGGWALTGVMNMTIIVLPAFLALQFAMYNRTAASAYKKAVSQNGGNDVVIEHNVTEDRIVISGNNSLHVEYTWDQFSKVISLKNLFLLMSNGGQAVLVPKNTFEIGTSEEFLQFIQSKQIPLKKH